MFELILPQLKTLIGLGVDATQVMQESPGKTDTGIL